MATPGRAPAVHTRPESDSQPAGRPTGVVWPLSANRRRTQTDRQIWIIDGDGGEAYQLTAMRDGAANPVWSPDGRYLAFLSAVDDAFVHAAGGSTGGG